ncbi:MAG: YhjD/YihY/BrkB family envelope integrity protein, partial [Betaproteobacteria bacterium]
VWIGAFVTSVLFSFGKFLIGLYIGKSGVESSYGAAGALVILLIWVYYSAQIFFLGAEFTKVYAESHGSRKGVKSGRSLQASDTAARIASTGVQSKRRMGGTSGAGPESDERC